MGVSPYQKMSPEWVRQMLDSYSTLCDTFCAQADPAEVQSLSAALEHSRRVMVEEKAKFQLLWDLMPRRQTAAGGASASLLFRDEPLAYSTAEDRLRTMARRHELQSPRTKTKADASARVVPRQRPSPLEWSTSARRMTTSDRWAEPFATVLNDPLPKSHPKLSKLLKIHRHGPRAARNKSGSHALALATPGGHARAKSAPLMDWGGAQPVLSSSAKKPSPITIHNPPDADDKENSPKMVPFPVMELTRDDPSTTRSGVVSTRSRVAVTAKAPNMRELLSPTRELQERVARKSSAPSMAAAAAATAAVYGAAPYATPGEGGVAKSSSSAAASSSSPSPSVTREAVQNLRLELPPLRNVEIDFEPHGYRHLSFLAEGSLGVLHLVESLTEPGTLWVAKLVDLTLVRNRAEASQALLEAELLCRLQHPNIVAYRASFISDDYLVIIMEYCEAGDLQSYLQRAPAAVAEPQVIAWLSQICAGLAHMHSRHVLHCDLKSSNIFLGRNLAAKIGDLGIARELRGGAAALSPRRCPRGTPLYMSPEMCQKEALTERSDCWAVGCIIYEVCNLRHAFASNLNLERVSERGGRVYKDNESVLSAISGFTHRSDLSLACKRMLRNIKGDIRRLKKTAPADGLPTLVDGHHLSYWRSDARPATVPRLLPPQYGPLLNYIVCAMLEPRPSNRPSLDEIAQLAHAALQGEDDDLDDETQELVPNERTTPRTALPPPPRRTRWYTCRTCFNP